MNVAHVVVCLRSGAGGRPWRCRTLPTVCSETSCPRLASTPTIRSSPQDRFSSAMRTINSSTSLLIRGRPGVRRFCEPSNLRATSLRYQARMVSGRAAIATSPSALRPRRRPISPRVRKLQPPLQLAPQDPVFSSQILIPQQQLLVHRPRNVGQDTCPLHESPPICPPIRKGLH